MKRVKRKKKETKRKGLSNYRLSIELQI